VTPISPRKTKKPCLSHPLSPPPPRLSKANHTVPLPINHPPIWRGREKGESATLVAVITVGPISRRKPQLKSTNYPQIPSTSKFRGPQDKQEWFLYFMIGELLVSDGPNRGDELTICDPVPPQKKPMKALATRNQ